MNKKLFLITVAVLILIPLGIFAFATQPKQQSVKKFSGKNNPFNQRYSQNRCEGKGTRIFTYSPMKIEDIGRIEPYGIMIDAHVIPTSHGYISPAVFNSPADAYPVYAVADGYIVQISFRGEPVGDKPTKQKAPDYQMYFEHSCTFYSYYDLLTSLSPKIAKEASGMTGTFWNKGVRIPVKAGELVGRIGGRTVDFAVWNFEKEPAYFVNPNSYKGDEDRFYLDDMFLYFQEPLKSQLLAKNLRTEEPRSGKVAYDIKGKLVGNWFKSGSGGFFGLQSGERKVGDRYWDGHLSISYDFIDPAKIKFSIGNFNGKAAQFNIAGNSPDPATIGVESGAIKYELISSTAPNTPAGIFAGTVLLQLIEPSKLKLELFPNQKSTQISGFTNKALIYER